MGTVWWLYKNTVPGPPHIHTCSTRTTPPVGAEVKWSESRSVVSNSLRLHGLWGPWGSPDKNTGVGEYFPFSRGSFQPRDRAQVSCIGGRFSNRWATRVGAEVRVKPTLAWLQDCTQLLVTVWGRGGTATLANNFIYPSLHFFQSYKEIPLLSLSNCFWLWGSSYIGKLTIWLKWGD